MLKQDGKATSAGRPKHTSARCFFATGAAKGREEAGARRLPAGAAARGRCAKPLAGALLLLARSEVLSAKGEGSHLHKAAHGACTKKKEEKGKLPGQRARAAHKRARKARSKGTSSCFLALESS